MNQNNPQVDNDVLNLAKAIRQKESGGDYSAVGDAGTSTGAFQFQPNTWKTYAGEILGDQNAQMTKENQNAVVYGKIKKWKDAGWNPAQVAAAWNSNEQKAQDGSWMQNKGTTTINGKQISYDTPQYVKDVLNNYHKLKYGQQAPYQLKTQPTSVSEQPQGQPQGDNLGSQLQQRASTAGSALQDIGKQLSGQPGTQNWWSDLLHVGGAAAGGVGDIINAGLNLIPGVKQGENWIGGQVAKAADTEAGRAVISSIQGFQKSHPEMAQDIGDIANIATLIPVFRGASIVGESVLGSTLKNVAVNGVKRTLEDVTGEAVSKGIVKDLLENNMIDIGKSKIGSSAGKTVIKVINPENLKNVTSDKGLVSDILNKIDGKPYSYGKVMSTVEHKAGAAGAAIGYGATGGVAGGAEGLLGGWLAKKAAKGAATKLIKTGMRAGKPSLLGAVKGVGMVTGGALGQNAIRQ